MRPLKRLYDNEPFTPEEQAHVLKKLKTHHSNTDHTISLHSGNHTTVKLQPLVTPRVGSSTCSRETRRTRSLASETFFHSTSTPSNTNQRDDDIAQMTSIIRRNTELITSSAPDAGVTVLHKLTFEEMLQLEKITLMTNKTIRMARSFFNSIHLSIFPSEHKMKKHMKGMIPDTDTGNIKLQVDGEDVHVTFVRVTDTVAFIQQHIQHLSNTNQLVQYYNMPPNVLFIETQADKGKQGISSCHTMS
jgi:hypothetical protein